MYLKNAAAGHKRLSPCSMRSYAQLCLVQAPLGLQPARIEVRVNGLSSPLELAPHISMRFCIKSSCKGFCDAGNACGKAGSCQGTR